MAKEITVKKKKLLTIWLGEFGAEMFFWIPELKRLNFNRNEYEVYCASYRGRMVLYDEICDYFVSVGLSKEEKDYISVGRLNGYWLDEGKKKWGISDEYLEQLKNRKNKYYSIIYGRKVYDRIVKLISPDKILTTNSIEINKYWYSVRNSLGIYEHIKIKQEFVKPFERYVVIYPRGMGDIDSQIFFPIEYWEEITNFLIKKHYKVLYFPSNELDKKTHILNNCIDIKKMQEWNEDNSVEYQTFLVKNADFIIGSETGALHLGVFAPAKHIIAFFQRPKNIKFPWQWKLINENKVIVHDINYNNIGKSEILKMLEEDLDGISRKS